MSASSTLPRESLDGSPPDALQPRLQGKDFCDALIRPRDPAAAEIAD
jgi:hypothetical protein